MGNNKKIKIKKKIVLELLIIIKDYNHTILRTLAQNTIIGGQLLYNILWPLLHIIMNLPQVYICPLLPECPNEHISTFSLQVVLMLPQMYMYR